MADISRRAIRVITSLAVAAALVVGAATMLFWAITPDVDVGSLLDRVRPYLPLQYG
jgi:hypothetical protein